MAESQKSVPAGWYRDPGDGQQEVYWDGGRYTDAHRPVAPIATAKPEGVGGLAIAGYVFAVLIPIVGLILGVIVGASHKEGKNHGGWIIGASCVAFILWLMILVA